MNNKKKCFVIIPFSKTQSCTEQKWTDIFEYIIKPAVEENGLGYECERSVAGRENIVKGILEALNKANVVIADLTDKNPNVFYELGVRHTLTNRTILIAQGKKHIPFDLRPYPVAFYNESPAKIAEFKRDIKKKLEDIEKNPERADNPVADFLKERNIELLAHEKSTNLKKLSALISEMSRNLISIKPILTMCQENQEARKKNKQTSVLSIRFENNCLGFLLANWYILLPEMLLKSLSTFNYAIVSTNSRLDLWANERYEDSIEKNLIEGLPLIKQRLETFMREINKIRMDYINDNYQEIEAPPILLVSPEHEEYLKLTG